MPNIDLTIVAGRRPELLRRTLESFHSGMLRHFDVASAIINIDPIWGDAPEEGECVQVSKSYFPNARVLTGEKASFAAAVKRVWSQTKSEFVFHLEDDWLLNEEITPAILDRFNDPPIAQVSLMSKEKNWDRARRGDFHYVKRHTPLFGGFKWPIRKKVTAFTTSPSFIRGEFARQWASLLNDDLDPEKQGYMGINKRLEEFMKPFRNYIYSGVKSELVITDTGREWREARCIEKKIIDGKSVWTNRLEA
jgi:hypothetical protein